MQRRRVGLAELPALGVEDARSEVLGLADDPRVGHAAEHAAISLAIAWNAPPRTRSVIGSTSTAASPAGPDASRARTRATKAHTPWLVGTVAATASPDAAEADLDDDVAERSTRATSPGDDRRRVELVDDRRARHPVAGLERRPIVVAPSAGVPARRGRGTCDVRRARRGLRRIGVRLGRRRREIREPADPDGVDVQELDVRLVVAAVIALVMSWKSRAPAPARRSPPARSDSDRSS